MNLISRFLPIVSAISIGVIFGASTHADPLSALPDKLELAAPFTDHMILQRNKPVTVWGFAAPGDQISVEFAGQVKQIRIPKLRGRLIGVLPQITQISQIEKFTKRDLNAFPHSPQNLCSL